ncbi:TetR/AcrR family transcriptional regulator [Dongia sp.]|uniref:TetR/AcrR family transcriptional regulator n=1 Tax=Dongia sp. TaxID=1977262 RepID=UPI0035B3BA66
MARNSNETRRRLVEAADKLFYGQGIQAVGVDAVAQAAGVTKRTLYYHFKSKDDLIAAYLDARDLPTLGRYQGVVAQDVSNGPAAPAAEQIARIFAQMEANARNKEWKGCSFVRAASEFAALVGHPARVAAAKHKKRFEDWLLELLRAEGVEDAAMLARQIMILFDGAVTQILIHRDTSYARSAGAAAQSLLRAYQKANPPRPSPRKPASRRA